MLEEKRDMVFLAQYEASFGAGNFDPNTCIKSWIGVYGDRENACLDGAKFIRDVLFLSLSKYKKPEQLSLVVQAIETGNDESIISEWNELFPQHKIKIYKTAII
jgi:hypothetical protein